MKKGTTWRKKRKKKNLMRMNDLDNEKGKDKKIGMKMNNMFQNLKNIFKEILINLWTILTSIKKNKKT